MYCQFVLFSTNKMKNKKRHSVGTVPKSDQKTVGGKIDTQAYIYMTTHFPGLVNELE